MRQRTRKLIGTTLLVVFVPLYALFVMALANPLLLGKSTLTQTLFFLVTGLFWVLPAGWLIAWMLRRDDRPPD